MFMAVRVVPCTCHGPQLHPNLDAASTKQVHNQILVRRRPFADADQRVFITQFNQRKARTSHPQQEVKKAAS